MLPNAELRERPEAPPGLRHGEVEDERAGGRGRLQALELIAAFGSRRVRSWEYADQKRSIACAIRQ